MGKGWGTFCLALVALGRAQAQDAAIDAESRECMPAVHALRIVEATAPAAEERLVFRRQFSVDAYVTGSLADSASIAGVPAATLPEVMAALGHALDLERDLRTGDRFYMRWEEAFTIDGQPTGDGRVLSAELRTARKGTVAITRFRPLKAGPEEEVRFYFSNGRQAAAGPIQLPLDRIQVTSGFGLRPDPLDQPERVPPVVVPPAKEEAPPPPRKVEDQREIMKAYAGFYPGQLGSARDAGGTGGFSDIDRIMAERRVRAREEQARAQAEKEAAEKEAAARQAAPPPPAAPQLLYMHEGLDLLANAGTPVHAAADGVVTLARADRGYGNAVHVEHARKTVTLYAHLSRFAPGIAPGVAVRRGDVIGFVGSTGRSTGAHLHFEVLVGGRPLDPQSMTQPPQLAGFDLARFRKQVAREQQERTREVASRP